MHLRLGPNKQARSQVASLHAPWGVKRKDLGSRFRKHADANWLRLVLVSVLFVLISRIIKKQLIKIILCLFVILSGVPNGLSRWNFCPELEGIENSE